MTPPSLLWVTPEPADRLRAGGSIRQSHLLEAVARVMPVDVLAVGGGVDEHCARVVRDVEELPEPVVRRHPELVPGTLREVWETEVLRLTPPLADTRIHRRLLRSRLRLRAPGYEIVHLEHDRLGPLARELQVRTRTITLHNLRSEQAAHRLAREPSPAGRWLARRERTVALAFEARVAHDFDRVFVTSAEDAAALRGDSTVVPNGVDVEAVRPGPPVSEPRMVFTGLLDWWPNVQGLQWFCNAVLPRVWRRLPAASLTIVGRNPVQEVRALANHRVHIHADVPSVVPFLHAARVAVVPLHIGSGTRLKALEAMAAGRPVVGTRIGLAGLHLESGVHASVVDEPGQMADGITHLLRDDSAAAAMASAGRKHVEEHHDWHQIARLFAETMRDLADSCVLVD
jgi:glycosyltransferase involved in cell wall biosynthesis